MNHASLPTIATAPEPPAAPAIPIDALASRVSANWLFSWTARGGLAVLDQGLFAGSHFVLNVLLARWLPPAEYGAFALAYSLFLLISALHSAVLLEPMGIFGSGKYLSVRRGYLGILLRGHFALTLPMSVGLAGAAAVAAWIAAPNVAYALLAFAVVLPFLLLSWLTRRAFYIELRPGWAVAGGVVYFTLLLATASWLFRTGRLTPASAILAMGATAFVAAAVQLTRLRPRRALPTEGLTSSSVAFEHWQYGSWALASGAAIWLALNVYYIVLPAWFGLAEAGAMKALMNLANPALHSLMAFSLLLTPLLVRHRDRGGVPLMWQTVRRLNGLFLLGAAGYLVLLWVFRTEVLRLLYGGKYLDYSALPILLVGLLPLGASLTATLGSALRALELPNHLFWCYGVSGGVALLAGVPLTFAFGLTGALGGLLLSYAATAVSMAAFLRRSGWSGRGHRS